jgi:hypothetical protein
VLASLQLDATLASITQEARHDGALAERLVYWKKAFREKGAYVTERQRDSQGVIVWWRRTQQGGVLLADGLH